MAIPDREVRHCEIFVRTMALLLGLTLVLPNPALAFRPRQIRDAGARETEKSPQLAGLEERLLSVLATAGLEEVGQDYIDELRTLTQGKIAVYAGHIFFIKGERLTVHVQTRWDYSTKEFHRLFVFFSVSLHH